MSFGIQLPAYGDPHWKTPVSSESALPATGNQEGDARLAMAENTLWAWQSGAWVQISGGGGGNAFTIIQTPAGTSPTADSPDSTLTLTSSDSTVTITGNSATDTVDFKGYKLPTQTGNSGKYLTTNGTTESWGTVASGAAWGSITGTLSSQTDLNTALSGKLNTSGGTMSGDIAMSAQRLTSMGDMLFDASGVRWVGMVRNAYGFGFDGTTGSIGIYVGGSVGTFNGSGLSVVGLNPNNSSTSIGNSGNPFEKTFTRQLSLTTGYTNAQMHAMTPVNGTMIQETTNNIVCVYLNGSWYQLSMTAAP